MKNIDKVRAMSAEELAKIITTRACNCCGCEPNSDECFQSNCINEVSKWLRQEQQKPLPSFEVADVIETVNNRYVVIWENTVIGVKERYRTNIPAYICPIDDVLTHETVTTVWRHNPKEKLFEKIWGADNEN